MAGINVRREFASVGLGAGGGVFAPAPLPSGDLDATQATGGATMRRFDALGRAIDLQTQALVGEADAVSRVGAQVATVGRSFVAQANDLEERKRQREQRVDAANREALAMRSAAEIYGQEVQADPSGRGLADRVGTRLRQRVTEIVADIPDENYRAEVESQLGIYVTREELKARAEEARMVGAWDVGELGKRLAIKGNDALRFRGPEQNASIASAIADIDDSVQDGIISATEAEKKKAAFRAGVRDATIEADRTANAATAWANLSSGSYDHLFANDGEKAAAVRLIRADLAGERKAVLDRLVFEDADTAGRMLARGELDRFFSSAEEKVAASTLIAKGIVDQRRQQIEDRERAERLAAKRVADEQESEIVNLYTMQAGGTLTLADVDRAISSRRVKLSDGLALRRDLTAPAREADDDEAQLFHRDLILRGQGDRTAILNDPGLTPGTKRQLLEQLYAHNRETPEKSPFDQVVTSHDYKAVTASLRRDIVTTGALSALDTGQSQRLNGAYRELDDRLRQGLQNGSISAPSDVWKLYDDISPRYRSEGLGGGAGDLPRLRYGSADDIDGSLRLLADALQNGEIGEAEAAREMNLIERYEDMKRRRDAADQARKAAPKRD